MGCPPCTLVVIVLGHLVSGIGRIYSGISNCRNGIQSTSTGWCSPYIEGPAMVGYTEASPASSRTLQMPHMDTVSASGVLLTALPVPPWGPAHSPGRPPAAPSPVASCCIHVLCYVCHPRLLNQAPLTGQSSQPHPENWGCPHTNLISISWYHLQIALGQMNTKYNPVNIMPARHAYRSKTVAVPICNAAVRQN